ATSVVDYGTTASYEVGSESDSSLVSSHSVSLSGLTEGQEYHFRVRSSDLCGNQATSSDETFITSDETAPVISDIVAEAASTTSVTITWTTDEPTTSTVNYGTTTGYGDTSSDATLTTEHSVTIAGLEPGTEYHFEIVSEDASGNAATSSDETVTTDSGAVTNVSGVSVTDGDGSATLSWTNPTDDAFAGVLVLMCTDAYPSDESDPDCETVYDGSGTTTTVSGLTNGTTYYFGFFAYDNEGQFASGALATGTPSATEEEVPTSEEQPPAATPPEGGTTDTAGTGTTDTGATGTTDTGGSTETTTDTGGETPGEVPAGGTTEEGTPEIPPTSVSGEDSVPMGHVSFFVANRLIQLAPTSSGVVRMLSSRPLRVSLLSKDIVKQVSRVQFVLADGAYLMARSTDGLSYVADVSSPGSSGSYAIAVSIYYADGTAQSISYTADVVDDGYVYATTDDGQAHAVGGATVTLLANGTVTWDGSPYGQFNPMTTGNTAEFGWYVPNTTYVLSAAPAAPRRVPWQNPFVPTQEFKQRPRLPPPRSRLPRRLQPSPWQPASIFCRSFSTSSARRSSFSGGGSVARSASSTTPSARPQST
ncbi:MAG: hypothetical protein EBT21_04950, partial [Actinobacteria bacterium]|nr:hypothetical protein [Actinomycetota bacterium]